MPPDHLYQLIIADDDQATQSNAEIARLVAAANEFEISQAASHLDDRQRNVFWCRISDRIRSTGTMAMLETGAMLTLFEHTTTFESRGELVETMSAETGISRPQIYRTQDAFRCFGRELLLDPSTAGRCTCEALKILSGASVDQSARDAAFGALRSDSSYRLTIKEAKRLCRKHSPDSGSKPDQAGGKSPSPKNADVLWRFRNPKLSIVVQRSKSADSIDHDAILIALEEALVAYRSETIASHSTNLVA